MPRHDGSSLRDATIVDASSLYQSTAVLSERYGKTRVTLDYSCLRICLESVRRGLGWRPATKTIALLATDPDSEGQRRFKDMLCRAGYDVSDVHYRDAFVSLPPGQSISEASAKSVTSFAAHLSYIAGLMARHADPQVLVVTHLFELCGPLTDLACRVAGTGGRSNVGLAYFLSLLDYRWGAVGLTKPGHPIEFVDLEPYSQELLGLDLPASQQRVRSRTGGLDLF